MKTFNTILCHPTTFIGSLSSVQSLKPFVAKKFAILPHILFIVRNENEFTISVRMLWFSYTKHKHTQEYGSTKNNRTTPKNPPKKKKIHAVFNHVPFYIHIYIRGVMLNTQCTMIIINVCMYASTQFSHTLHPKTRIRPLLLLIQCCMFDMYVLFCTIVEVE